LKTLNISDHREFMFASLQNKLAPGKREIVFLSQVHGGKIQNMEKSGDNAKREQKTEKSLKGP